jgi:hypothetical protein
MRGMRPSLLWPSCGLLPTNQNGKMVKCCSLRTTPGLIVEHIFQQPSPPAISRHMVEGITDRMFKVSEKPSARAMIMQVMRV